MGFFVCLVFFITKRCLAFGCKIQPIKKLGVNEKQMMSSFISSFILYNFTVITFHQYSTNQMYGRIAMMIVFYNTYMVKEL